MAERRAGLEDARPCEPECRRRDEERRSLDRPHDATDRTCGRAPAAIAGADDRAAVPRHAEPRVRRRQHRLLDDERHDARERRLEEAVREPEQRREHEDRPCRFTWPVTSSPKNVAITHARARSEPIISSRREWRSASTPPQSSVTSMASDSSASTNPSELAFPVRSVTRQPSATMNAASPTNETVWPPQRSRKSRLENATNVPCRGTVTVRGYRRARACSRRRLRRRLHARQAGARPRARGLRAPRRALRARRSTRRATTTRAAAALVDLKRHPELDHDEEIWIRFTQRIIEGMGGAGDTYAARVRDGGRLGARTPLRAVRGRAADARRAARPRAEARAALEQRPRPRRVRRRTTG